MNLPTFTAPAMQGNFESHDQNDPNRGVYTYWFSGDPRDTVEVRVDRPGFGKNEPYRVQVSAASQRCRNAEHAMQVAQLWQYAAMIAARLEEKLCR